MTRAQERPGSRPVLTWIVIGTLTSVLLVLLALAMFVFPSRIYPPLSTSSLEKLKPEERPAVENARLTLQNGVRGILVQGIGGLLVLITASIAGAFTWEQIKVTRDGQLTDRYTKAVDQLGNDKSADTRIGGVYALDRIARNSPIDRHAIANVLNAFVLERARLPSVAVPDARTSSGAGRGVAGRESGQEGRLEGLLPLPWRRAEVQAAVDVLGQELFEGMVVLPFVDLRKAVLEEAKFVNSVFRSASLAGSVLTAADFRGATLEDARLEKANLQNAKLQGADLRNARLYGADLLGANLDGADIRGARYDAATRWPDDRFEPTARGTVNTTGNMPSR